MVLAPIQVGRLRLERPLILAPMAGVTSWPFRILCKELGCGLGITEFVSAHAVVSGNLRTREMIWLHPVERPAGVQIFGSDPDIMARAAEIIVGAAKPDLIDINMGCPAPKIVAGGGGSSLLCRPGLAQEMAGAVARAVHPVPVTAKIRIGWDADQINAVEMARRLEQAGIAMLTVHGRTRQQNYSGRADWDTIAAVAAAVDIPVLGNGDVTTPAEALMRVQTAGVSGLAIGRGALGNPWLFDRIWQYLAGGELLPEPTPARRLALALRHLDLMIGYRGEKLAVREMRKHFAWYVKGLPGAADVRNLINAATEAEAVREIISRIVPSRVS